MLDLPRAVEGLIDTKQKTSPFPKEAVQAARKMMASFLDDPSEADLIPEGQPFHTRLISGLARKAGDKDWEFPLLIEGGVPLGVEHPFGDSPGIWPPMQDPLFDHNPVETQELEARDNYKSAVLHEDDIRVTYEEEIPMGMVLAPYTPEQAATACNCQVDELIHGALGAIEAGDKIRTIHDATATGVNDRIRNNQKEKTTAPTVVDFLHTRAVDKFTGRGRVKLLKADVSKAHRRIKIRKQDWKYITAKVGDDIYVNKVGTYGVASAQYYWGRMAALIIRLMHEIYPGQTWMLVYVDDFLIVLDEETAPEHAALLLLILECLGCPLSWHKTDLDYELVWLGYTINADDCAAFPTPDKIVLIKEALSQMKSNNPVKPCLVESTLGRLVWLTQVFSTARPFLSPLYAWLHVLNKHRHAGRPNKLVQLLANLIDHFISMGPRTDQLFYRTSEGTGATDASAHSDRGVLAGWWLGSASGQKGDAIWFIIETNHAMHPWLVQHKEDAKRSISALELMAITVLLYVTSRRYVHTDTHLQLPNKTDNEGNAYALLSRSSKTWPHVAMLAEIAAIQHRHTITLRPSHEYREHNTWADDLTNLEVEGWNPANRLQIDIENLEWELMPGLLKAAGFPYGQGKSQDAWDQEGSTMSRPKQELVGEANAQGAILYSANTKKECHRAVKENVSVAPALDDTATEQFRCNLGPRNVTVAPSLDKIANGQNWGHQAPENHVTAAPTLDNTATEQIRCDRVPKTVTVAPSLDKPATEQILCHRAKKSNVLAAPTLDNSRHNDTPYPAYGRDLVVLSSQSKKRSRSLTATEQ